MSKMYVIGEWCYNFNDASIFFVAAWLGVQHFHRCQQAQI